MSRIVAVAANAALLVAALAVGLPHLGGAAPWTHVFATTTSVAPPLSLAVRVDSLSACMLLLTTLIALLVQVYSVTYLRDDPRYPTYAALVALFTIAMITVVIADDLWVLLVGWELMGACSYFLIGHHWERPEARAGAVKAFLMTWTADLGLVFAVLLIGQRAGTYRLSELTHAHGQLVALLLVVAVIGKSAQFPLHTWLPDAMPGPTPISALIHAATMVAAGVYLLARLHALLTHPASIVLALVASVTMLLSAAYAVMSGDLKRVLAWSTVSQLAYMVGAVAAGAWPVAVLHLLAHGVFKALLFLGAGSVAHAVGGTTRLAELGGLRHRLPQTFATMTVGFASLAGLVPFVGFFSKDGIVHAVDQGDSLGGVWTSILIAAMAVTVALTAVYCVRCWMAVFLDRPWLEGEEPVRERAHEPLLIVLPLHLLAVLSVLGGLVFLKPGVLLATAHASFSWLVAGISTSVIVVATVVAWWRGAVLPAHDDARPRVDIAYGHGLVRPTRLLARMAEVNDRDVVEGYAATAGWSVHAMGRLATLAHRGNVRAYVAAVLIGAFAIAIAVGGLT